MQEAGAAQAESLVVEVLSPSNTGEEIWNKRKVVFARGAGEFRGCDRKGNLQFFGPRARLSKSRLCPGFPSGIASGRVGLFGSFTPGTRIGFGP